ncbi:hypothetical protein ACFV1W_34835 [Kitasatospora sp. NPDC059648]|uniref:hypothetical protein n=1 Tax=Kitasatospora sp. NPDC059648 TaxID=3346894 RepID=UPI00367B8845
MPVPAMPLSPDDVERLPEDESDEALQRGFAPSTPANMVPIWRAAAEGGGLHALRGGTLLGAVGR